MNRESSTEKIGGIGSGSSMSGGLIGIGGDETPEFLARIVILQSIPSG
jgi:hypothetical protein